MMFRLLVAIALAGLLGVAGGWWLRETIAIDACLDAGGKWAVNGGYCLGAKWGELQP